MAYLQFGHALGADYQYCPPHRFAMWYIGDVRNPVFNTLQYYCLAFEH